MKKTKAEKTPVVQSAPIPSSQVGCDVEKMPMIKRGQKITEEMGVHKQWYIDAKDDKMSLVTLPKFLHHLMNDYNHDYGTICHAITAGGMAAMWAMNRAPQGGISGFQAGAIQWEFIRHWMHKEGSLHLVEYNDMLYPQHADRFAKTLSLKTFQDLQKTAKQNLKSSRGAHPHVIKHWKSIVAGKVPFGYKLKED